MKDPKRRVAAALVIQALRLENRQTATQLAMVLQGQELGPRYVPTAVRLIRDTYGANALVVTGGSRGVAPVYVLDPDLDEGQVWAFRMTKRNLTEARHIQHVLDWLAEHAGNRGAVKAARRNASRLVEDLEDLYADLKK